MNKNSKILVTGGAGLVGSALIERLRDSGYKNVVGLGRKDCDLLDLNATKNYFSNLSPEYVFHCAARVYGIMGNMNNKGISFYENVSINTNVVESSRLVGVKKIVAMGTGAVYPYPSPGLPLKEEMIFMGNPHAAEDSYAHAKRAMLAMLRAYEESYELNWAYVVSCNLFGANDKFDTVNGHVVPSLIKKFYDAKLANKDVLVWGNGSARRDFMYVKDAASALISIMEKANGAVNLGSGEIYSIGQIVDYLTEITNMHDRIKWDASKPNGQDYRAYDLVKLNSTGFHCKYSIKDGLEETWNWYVKNSSNEE
jgi:GDP-L-fucose synthase